MSQQKHNFDPFLDIQEFMPAADDNSYSFDYLIDDDSIEFHHERPNGQAQFQNNLQKEDIHLQNIHSQEKYNLNNVSTKITLNKAETSISQKFIENQDIQLSCQSSTTLKCETQLYKRQSSPLTPLKNAKVKRIKKLKSQSEKYRKSKRISDQKYQNHRNISSSQRNGKHKQSKTQKFLYFMTRYHYSKNFYQFLRKKSTDINDNYQNLKSSEKVLILQRIIAQLKDYNMLVHYKVENSVFLNSFSVQQKIIIRSFFHQIVQRTYLIKLLLVKKQLINPSNTQQRVANKFFDKEGEKSFNKLFQQALESEKFSESLKKCEFERRCEQVYTRQAEF